MEEVNEYVLAFKNNSIFYLQETFKNYDINFEILEEKNNNWFAIIEYHTRVIINNKKYNFIIYKTIKNPVQLLFRYNICNYIGVTDIFNKNNDIIKHDLIINEIDKIENQLKKEEKLINEINFQIKGSANLMTRFNIPAEIALLLFL